MSTDSEEANQQSLTEHAQESMDPSSPANKVSAADQTRNSIDEAENGCPEVLTTFSYRKRYTIIRLPSIYIKNPTYLSKQISNMIRG